MKISKYHLVFLLFTILLLPKLTIANNYYLLIGGGPSLSESQSSIEQNVIWSEKIIRHKHPDSEIRIFYADGDNPDPDIVNHLRVTAPDAGLLPFDRIFSEEADPKEYYNHTIENVTGTTAPQFMKPIILDDFKKLTNNDRVLILYNGHGGYAPDDLSNNYLRLWGEKKLTVYDFESMLSVIKPDIPVRYIMTQCFSGGFTNAIHPNADKETFELTGNRCGFMSQSSRRESEGCTASLNIGDYRDYSTYFFAAIDGKTRQNTPLKSNPDLNNDSIVSLREAHLYTLATAFSSDLSRTTSEDYLEKWEPWYLRWISDTKRQKESIYYEIALKLAANNEFDTAMLNNPSELRKLRSSLLKAYRKLSRENNEVNKKIKAIQDEIKEKLSDSFPDLKDAYKSNFSGYDNQRLDEAKKTILQYERYSELKHLFSHRDEVVTPLIESKRKLVQAEKMFRLLKLAKLDSLLPIFSNNEIRSNFSKLLACENTSL